MSNHLVKLLYKVLKAYGVSITRSTIEKTIFVHPDYPSIRCISDALDCWKVKHVVMKFSLEKLQALDVPVITHFKRGEYVCVTQVTDTKVHYWIASGKEKIASRAYFENEWSGMVLAIEDMNNAGEPYYRRERKKEIKENSIKYFIAGGCMVLVAILTYFSWSNDGSLSLLPKMMLLCVNAVGFYISYTLILKEKNRSNAIIQKFCKAGTHIDCNQVTNSQYSKFFGLFSWAELGMAYFSTIILWVVAIAPVSTGWLMPMWWFLLAPLPFSVWSLFTQAFLIRKWCLFCCAIAVLLWINASILYAFLPFNNIFLIVESSLFALLLLLCTVIAMYVSKTGDSHNLYFEQRETARIKYDFNTLQSQLSEFHVETNKVGFVWGNLRASHEFTLYVSIACAFCGESIKELRRLTEIYPNIGYRLIFVVKKDEFDHKSNIIIRHFLSLHKTMNKNEFFDMLDSWYTTLNKKLEVLQKEYPIISVQNNKEEMDSLYQFSQLAKINYTPAILLNGRLLSQLYSYYRDMYCIARTLNAE